MSDDVTLDTKALDSLISVLTQNKTVIRVGILGDKNARTGPNNSNATVGATHEFGTTKVPKRSFLRMPIETEFSKELEKAGGITDDDMKEIIEKTSTKMFSKKMGVLAVSTILRAFDSGGFGTWKDLSPYTWSVKKTKQILVETHQLRDSITFEVKEIK